MALKLSMDYEKLPLESALEETPQILSLVNLYTEDANYLGEYVRTLHHISSQLVSVHNKLTSTYQELAKHLKSFSPRRYMTENDTTGELTGGLKQFANIVSEMSSWEHILATQIADGVVYPLSKFIGSELQEVNSLGSLYHAANNEVDRAIGRYSRCRRKDPQQERHEAVDEVYNARKNFHIVALKYYSRLNQLHMGRQIALLQPILGLATAAKGHHQLGHESLSSATNDGFLSGVGVTMKGLVEDLQKEKEDTEELIDSMVTQSQLMYYPQPPGELASLPPDTTLSSKSGYLNVHRKYMGVMSSWERQFVFIEGGNLMGAQKSDIAGSLLLEMDSSTLAHATDTDDRLHVFTVVTAKKSVILQALNDRERDEWMLTIQRLCEEGGYVKSEGKLTPSSSFFSGVSQFFAGKLTTGTPSGNETGPSAPPSSATSLSATPSRSLRGDAIPKDIPIVFDMPSIGDESGGETAISKREDDEDSETGQTFSVRFLGSMGVNVDTGQTVVFEVMRRILAARAIHDMFSTSHLHLTVTASRLTLRDPLSKVVRLQHRLRAVHSENQRLVGYIVRQSDLSSNTKEGNFSCYVFESDEGGRDICSALGTAARQAYAHLLDQKTLEEKRKEETFDQDHPLSSERGREDITVSSLRIENMELRRRIDTLETEKTEIQQKHLKDTLDLSSSHRKDRQTDNEKLRRLTAQIESLRQEKERCMLRISALEQQINQYREQIREYRSRSSAVAADVRRVRMSMTESLHNIGTHPRVSSSVVDSEIQGDQDHLGQEGLPSEEAGEPPGDMVPSLLGVDLITLKRLLSLHLEHPRQT